MARNMENDSRHFIRCLKEAGRRVDRHYFQLDIAGSEESIYRERVYCYELYHQLRCVLGDSFPYKLDGEVDKAGHPIIRQELGARKPDFIVHVPGKMNRNLAVIEVKPLTIKNRISELREDLKTLQGFLDKARYYRAIMLIYGDGESDLPNEIPDEVGELREERILLVWHQGYGKRPVVVERRGSYIT